MLITVKKDFGNFLLTYMHSVIIKEFVAKYMLLKQYQNKRTALSVLSY